MPHQTNRLQDLVARVSTSAQVSAQNKLSNLAWPTPFVASLSRNLVLILGTQRSGTTLQYYILNAHSAIAGLDENYSRNQYPSPFLLLMNQFLGKRTVFKLPARTGELDQIRSLFPLCKIAWAVRNPYAVLSSMRRLQLKRGNWLDAWAGIELARQKAMFPEINQIRIQQTESIELAALVWKYKAMAMEKYQQAGFNVHLVKFEKLVVNPGKTLTPLLNDLGLAYEASQDDYPDKQRHLEHPANRVRPLDATRSKPDIDLSGREVEMINAVCGPEMQRLGYQLQ